MSDQRQKPGPGQRSQMTRKGSEGEEEPEGKPTLGRRESKMTSRQQRIVDALNGLDDTKLQTLTTRIGPDELAVALIDAGPEIKDRIAKMLPPEQLKVFQEYTQVGRDKLPGDVVDGVQGKLLRLV